MLKNNTIHLTKCISISNHVFFWFHVDLFAKMLIIVYLNAKWPSCNNRFIQYTNNFIKLLMLLNCHWHLQICIIFSIFFSSFHNCGITFTPLHLIPMHVLSLNIFFTMSTIKQNSCKNDLQLWQLCATIMTHLCPAASIMFLCAVTHCLVLERWNKPFFFWTMWTMAVKMPQHMTEANAQRTVRLSTSAELSG